MRGKIFVEAGPEFVDAALDVAIQSRDNGGDIFFAYGFVVGIGVIPNGGAGLVVTHRQLKRNSS